MPSWNVKANRKRRWSIACWTAVAVTVAVSVITWNSTPQWAMGQQPPAERGEIGEIGELPAEAEAESGGELATVDSLKRQQRDLTLVASLSIFVLAIFVGFEVISKVPPTLHTPLMSGSNAISGITVVGAMVAAGTAATVLGTFFGVAAIVLAMINVVGGFLVTHRMLMMFQRR